VLTDILLKNLQKQGFLLDQRHTHFVVAFSGGADSTVLLHLLSQLKSTYNISLTAAYVNHAWRGDGPEELTLIHQHCNKLKVPLVLVSPDKTIRKTETQARKARYKALTRLAQNLKAQAVLTAHHADDQVETLLFNLFRGTGLDGLKGIQPKLTLTPPDGDPIPVVRPLLDIFKEGILKYANSNRLEFFTDPTNTNTKHHRNALRQDVIPQIHQRFPHAKTAMIRLGKLLEGDLDILEDATQPVWDRLHLPTKGENELEAFDLNAFTQLSRAYQRRFIKQFLENHKMQVDYQHIENLIQFLEGEGRNTHAVGFKSLEKTFATSDSAIQPFLSIYKNRVALVHLPKDFNNPNKPMPGQHHIHPDPTVLQIPCTIRHVDESRFDFKIRINKLPPTKSDRIVVLRQPNTREMFVDVGRFWNQPLELRTRRPGDRFQPFGMSKAIPLKKYLINKGISRFERDDIPLLCCGSEVLWIIGYCVSDKLRIPESPSETYTHRIAQIRLLALDEPEELTLSQEEAKENEDETDEEGEGEDGEGTGAGDNKGEPLTDEDGNPLAESNAESRTDAAAHSLEDGESETAAHAGIALAEAAHAPDDDSLDDDF
jgi:tRNA(Ile)-lysidine synthase